MKTIKTSKRFALVFFISLSFLFLSCNQQEVNFSDLKPVVVELKYGESLYVDSKNIIVEFSKLEMESRCPEDVICIWEGEGVIELTVKYGSDEKKEIHLGTPKIETITIQGIPYQFTLIKLFPYPRTDKNYRPEDYIAYIQIEPVNEDPLVEVNQKTSTSETSVL